MGKMKATVADQPDAAPAVDSRTGCHRTGRSSCLGSDDAGKPHASKFGEADAELAIKAAGLMSMRVLPVTTDEHRAAASGAGALGRIFDVG